MADLGPEARDKIEKQQKEGQEAGRKLAQMLGLDPDEIDDSPKEPNPRMKELEKRADALARAIAREMTGTHWSGPRSDCRRKQRRRARSVPRLVRRKPEMHKKATTKRAKATTRCAIYTRKSSEEGLEQDFNSGGRVNSRLFRAPATIKFMQLEKQIPVYEMVGIVPPI